MRKLSFDTNLILSPYVPPHAEATLQILPPTPSVPLISSQGSLPSQGVYGSLLSVKGFNDPQTLAPGK